MILKRVIAPLLVGVVVVAAACQPAAEVLPTLAPTLAQDAPTQEPTDVPTAQPTSPPPERATLPPTWTPSPAAATETPIPATETPVPPVILPPSPLAACATFGVDSRNQTFFPLGSSPQVFWLPADGASSYRAALIDEFGEELLVDYTIDPTYIFPSDLFERDKRYAWDVYPMDDLGQQMCISIGDEIFPQ
ncbi:MAG: hypothetical protein H6672_09615 [Anaerolineaceae bacterium]|nr:hypothetical protein [Anaerolineaceae bacterium]